MTALRLRRSKDDLDAMLRSPDARPLLDEALDVAKADASLYKGRGESKRVKTDWAKASKFSRPEQSAGFVLCPLAYSWQRRAGETLSGADLTYRQFVLLACLRWLEERPGGAAGTTLEPSACPSREKERGS